MKLRLNIDEDCHADKLVIPFETRINRSRRHRINKYTGLIFKLASKVKSLKKKFLEHDILKKRPSFYPELTLEEIYKNNSNSHLPGIYFLFNKKGKQDYLVYVGQSKNILARITSHIDDKEKEFTTFSFQVVSVRKRRLQLEHKYISKFSPPYNKTSKHQVKRNRTVIENK